MHFKTETCIVQFKFIISFVFVEKSSTVSTAVTTCTTVTADASTKCSPAARRRRGSAAAQLYFKKDDENISLPDSLKYYINNMDFLHVNSLVNNEF